MNQESQIIEWKIVWKDEYLRWICDFANAQGDTLCIGKNDLGIVLGLPDANKLLEDLPNKIRDQLGLFPAINLKSKENLHYIEIKVDISPVAISSHGIYYWRSGAVKQELNGLALNEILLKKMGITWNRAIEKSASSTDIDEYSVSIFKNDAFQAGRVPNAKDCYKEGYINAWGQGVKKIHDECLKYELKSPEFLERSGSFLVTLKKLISRKKTSAKTADIIMKMSKFNRLIALEEITI